MHTRRKFIRLLLLCGLLAAIGRVDHAAGETEEPSTMIVYIGTYTRGRAEGIYRFTLDLDSGALTPRGATGGVENPSFLALHPTGRYLYSVAEAQGGAVAAFAIDPATGDLAPLNAQSTRGPGACHVALDPAGTTLIASNYAGGSVASFAIGDDGRLSPAVSFIQHEGRSVAPRQQGPHAHSATIDATGRFAVVADLGLDKLVVYALDAATGALSPHDPPSLKLHGGAGPRHFAFHPNGGFAYVINELDSTVTAMTWNPRQGVLTATQTVTTLPADFTGDNTTAEVVVHPSGRFLYGSNRGHDSIAIFAIDDATGELTPIGHEPTRGKEPRHFNVDPTGRWLLAANQKSDTVQVFRVDEATGALSAVGDPVTVPTPVCVKFLALSP